MASVPETLIIRINTPLYFANAEICMGKVRKLLWQARSPCPLLDGQHSTLMSNQDIPLSTTLLNGTHGSSSSRIVLPVTSGRFEKDVLPVSCDSSDKPGDFAPSSIISIDQSGVHRDAFATTHEKFVIILDMVAVTFVDLTGVQVLKKFTNDCLLEDGCRVILASCSGDTLHLQTLWFEFFLTR